MGPANRSQVSSVATNAVAVIGPTPGTLRSRWITGSTAAISTIRASALSSSALAVRIGVSNGAISCCSGSGSAWRSTRAMNPSTFPLGKWIAWRRSSAPTRATHFTRVRTSTSRAASSARTCRWRSLARWAGR